MTNRTITRDSTVAAKRSQSSADLGAETAILDLETGTYFSVDKIGTHVWGLVQEPTTVARICENLLERYDVSPEVCERDVLAFVERLVEVGLVEINSR
jgi:hypothetical protein